MREKDGAPHKHQWQRAELQRSGVLFKIHICMGHKTADGKVEPVVKAYDMQVMKSR